MMSAQTRPEFERDLPFAAMTETELKPILEALIYMADEPITEAALVDLLGKEHQEVIRQVLIRLVEQYQASESGLEIKQIANGYRMATKPEHHEWVRKYVKQQNPPTKLSLAALETLAVIAYKQPMTVPEIQEIRGVNAVSVLKTLLDKKLIATAGRKNVIGRPILYRTTKEFLLHFGLKGLDELPSLKEFEALARTAAGISLEEMADDALAQSVPEEGDRQENWQDGGAEALDQANEADGLSRSGSVSAASDARVRERAPADAERSADAVDAESLDSVGESRPAAILDEAVFESSPAAAEGEEAPLEIAEESQNHLAKTP
jgi:segregation and condensation protein B